MPIFLQLTPPKVFLIFYMWNYPKKLRLFFLRSNFTFFRYYRNVVVYLFGCRLFPTSKQTKATNFITHGRVISLLYTWSYIIDWNHSSFLVQSETAAKMAVALFSSCFLKYVIIYISIPYKKEKIKKHCTRKWSFPLRIFYEMWSNPLYPTGLVTFTEEMLSF